jgi:hypothetical protein
MGSALAAAGLAVAFPHGHRCRNLADLDGAGEAEGDGGRASVGAGALDADLDDAVVGEQLRQLLETIGVVRNGVGRQLAAAAVDDDDGEGVLVTVDPCEHAGGLPCERGRSVAERRARICRAVPAVSYQATPLGHT